MRRMPPASTRSLVLANGGLLVMVMLAGAFFPILEQLLRGWDVLSVTAARQLVGGIALWVVLGLRERRLPLPRGVAWRQLFLLGGAGIALSSVVTSMAVLYSGGMSAAIVSAANPIVAALVARLLYRQRLAHAVMIGAALAVAGGAIAILGGGEGLDGFHGGEVLMLVAGALWTWYSIAAQRLLAGHSQLAIAAWTTLPAGLVLLALTALLGATGLVTLHIDLGPVSLLMIGYAGLLSIGVGNVLWHYGVSRIGVAVATMYGNLMPVAAVLVTLWFGGSPTTAQLGGGAVILAGVLYAQIAGRRAAPAAPGVLPVPLKSR
jgi:drug/metabolite transporter (DMT)-like permease